MYYVIPDEVMERLLRDLHNAVEHNNEYLRNREHDPMVTGARNITRNVMEELATYRKGE